MLQRISRRTFTGAAVATVTSFGILRHARGDAPIELRASLDTAPSHPRNVALREFLSKVEAASGGQVKIIIDRGMSISIVVSSNSVISGKRVQIR